MISKDLVELIQQIRKNGSEDNRIEIKKAAGGCPKIYDTLSSFSNQSGGGIIIFGIDQDNNFDLCGVYDADDLQKRIMILIYAAFMMLMIYRRILYQCASR